MSRARAEAGKSIKSAAGNRYILGIMRLYEKEHTIIIYQGKTGAIELRADMLAETFGQRKLK